METFSITLLKRVFIEYFAESLLLKANLLTKLRSHKRFRQKCELVSKLFLLVLLV